MVGLGPGNIVLDADPASTPKGHSPLNFGPCLLWRNRWMDQDATWYEGRHRYLKFTVKSVGDKILKIGQHLEKVQAKTVAHFFPTRCIYESVDLRRTVVAQHCAQSIMQAWSNKFPRDDLDKQLTPITSILPANMRQRNDDNMTETTDRCNKMGFGTCIKIYATQTEIGHFRKTL